ncbi:phage antirepressor KilAC domain-containing protein [Williamsia sp. DF01-3]|nr:phage antirepressor KilAC domain-containing protein [Williamsia sp. DF01-3]
MLDITNTRNVAARLADDQKGVRSMDTLGGRQNIGVVNESGMYEVVIRSDKPEAVKFRRWITGTVLPEIRRTGSFGAPAALPMSEDEIVLHALTIQNRKIAALTAKVEADKPKVEAFDELMEVDGTYSFLAASKMLGWGRNVMMRDLRRLGILQGNNLPYQRYEHHFKVTPGTYKNRKTGETIPTATTTVRPMGLEFLRKKLNAGTEVAE